MEFWAAIAGEAASQGGTSGTVRNSELFQWPSSDPVTWDIFSEIYIRECQIYLYLIVKKLREREEYLPIIIRIQANKMWTLQKRK